MSRLLKGVLTSPLNKMNTKRGKAKVWFGLIGEPSNHNTFWTKRRKFNIVTLILIIKETFSTITCSWLDVLPLRTAVRERFSGQGDPSIWMPVTVLQCSYCRTHVSEHYRNSFLILNSRRDERVSNHVTVASKLFRLQQISGSWTNKSKIFDLRPVGLQVRNHPRIWEQAAILLLRKTTIQDLRSTSSWDKKDRN